MNARIFGASFGVQLQAECHHDKVMVTAYVSHRKSPCAGLVDARLEVLGCKIWLWICPFGECHVTVLDSLLGSVGQGELMASGKLQKSHATVFSFSEAESPYCA